VSELKLGLAGTHQKQNAILAVALARSFLQSRSENVGEGSFLPDPFRDGLIGARWPGRCQNVIDPKRSDFTWFLDGAHTVESLACCIQWFVTPGVGIPLAESTCTRTSSSFLIFNCTSGRSGEIFLRQVQETIRAQLLKYKRDIDGDLFDHVIFCANVTYADGHFKGDLTTKAIDTIDLVELRTQQALASAWLTVSPTFPPTHVHVLPSIEHAVKLVEQLQSKSRRPSQVLVTGSLHLVGGVIEVAGLSEVAL